MKHHETQVCFVALLTAALVSCGGDSPDPLTPGDDAPPVEQYVIPPQFAAHRFLPVNGTAELTAFDWPLEVVDLAGQNVIVIDSILGTLRCAGSGLACMRSRHSDAEFQNQVQTSCTMCVRDTGSCSGRSRAVLDLETFLGSGVAGDADYLAQGEQKFYSVCEAEGEYRLEQASASLPPLMLRLVDAMGQGPFSLGDDEIGPLRSAQFRTYSGNLLDPGWLVLMGAELRGFALESDGSITVELSPCDDSVVFCTADPDILGAGDVMAIYHEFPSDAELAQILAPENSATIDAFMASHGISSWASSAQLIVPEPRLRIVDRMISLELMREHLAYMDGLHQLKARGIPFAWFGFLPRRGTTLLCHPSEVAECEVIEAEVMAEEGRVIAEWQAQGFEVLAMNFLRFESNGDYRSLSDEPPHYSLFDGMILDVNLNASPPLDAGVDPAATLVNAVTAAAGELGTLPVWLSPWAGPMDFYAAGTFCEAEVCASDFTAYYALNEALFDAALNVFPVSQIQAFVIPLFDGSHFDIRDPQELRGGIRLNRVGETGFNNPLLNIYLSR